ncbi:hypothetical protein LSM04_008446 [Trypanosoma melophagium]|uniref:uncharacterized protein n=1 Tax=Trypanosoma melophagium TaxID=715481 RepID=UPI003519EBC8|nr:hypothetical protein LSM04_008446 [Trypanosoma melophagium]
MRLTSRLWCPSAGSTLTARLAQLAQRIDTLTPNKEVDNSLWGDVVAVAGVAGETRETDTAMALVLRLLHHRNSAPPAGVWAALIRDLAPYGDVEANTVLAYPGVTLDGNSYFSVASAGKLQYDRLQMERSGTGTGTSSLSSSLVSMEKGPMDTGILLRPTRETLLLTGGVVPLSARAPCSDGSALASLLKAFCSSYEMSSGEDKSLTVLKDVMDAVISTLQLIAATLVLIESSPVTRSLLRFFQVVFRSGKEQEKEEKQKEPLAEQFALNLIKVLPMNALGARVVILFLAEQCTSFPDDMIYLPLVRIAVRGLWLYYESVDDFSCLQQLQQVNDAVDVTLQRNANSGNSLGLVESDESDIRLLLSLALLRLMRLQADSPDIFLRDAVDIVDRCPVNLSVEYELLAAKVKLLDLFIDDPESSSTIYDDLLQSLRALVELRPRDSNNYNSNNSDNLREGHLLEEEKDVRRVTQLHFQEAHRLVVTAFAQSHVEERLNQAYTILVTHKYHGLIITRELMHPLLDVLSRRGDCRVFNIVDLCVLYSGSSIDYETLTYLFQACRVAGDFYRARTLYQLLREMIPGFLLRAPEAIKEALRGLKVLEPEPNHLFAYSFTVERDVDAAVAAAAVASAGVVEDEECDVQKRGPIRELPNIVKETSEKGTHTSH